MLNQKLMIIVGFNLLIALVLFGYFKVRDLEITSRIATLEEQDLYQTARIEACRCPKISTEN